MAEIKAVVAFHLDGGRGGKDSQTRGTVKLIGITELLSLME